MNNRKIIVVDTHLQNRWAVLCGVISVLSVVVGCTALIVFPQIINAFSRRRVLLQRFQLDELILSLPALVGVCGLVFLISAFLGLYFSHQVAGPIYKMEETLKDRLQGKPVGPISLRETDQLTVLSGLLNAYFENADLQKETLSQLLGVLIPILEKKENAVLTLEGEELETIISKIEAGKEALATSSASDA